MIKPFEKVIEKLILPEFPWIVDYEIIPIKISDFTLINVVYYTDGEFYFTEDHQKIEKETKTLYNMIGGGDNTIYKGVIFTSIENKGKYN